MFQDFADQYCQHIDDTVRYHLLMVYIRYYPSYEIPEIFCQKRDGFINKSFGRDIQSKRDAILHYDQTALSFCDRFQAWFEQHFPELMQDEYYAGKRFAQSVSKDDFGATPIVQWIKYAHRKPILPSERRPEGAPSPLCGRNKPHQVLPKQLTFGKWSCRRHYVDHGHPGYQPIHYWIMCRQGEPIPQELLFNDVARTKHEQQQTPLYMWIQYRPGEPIPQELKYEGWQKDESVKTLTPLMTWVKHRPTETIPEEIMYDDWKTYSRMEHPYSLEPYTPLLVWANYHPEKPIPKELIYEGCGSCLSKRGDPLLHSWMEQMCDNYSPLFMKITGERQIPELIIPEALKFPDWQRSLNRQKKTPIAVYVQRWPRAAEMPAEMLYDGYQDDYQDDIKGQQKSNLLTCWFANYDVRQKPVEPPEWILPRNPVSDEIKLNWYLTWVQNAFNDLGHIPAILLDKCILQLSPPKNQKLKNEKLTRQYGKAVTKYLNAFGHTEDKIYQNVFIFRQWCDGIKNIPYDVSFPEELKQLIKDNIPNQVQKAK